MVGELSCFHPQTTDRSLWRVMFNLSQTSAFFHVYQHLQGEANEIWAHSAPNNSDLRKPLHHTERAPALQIIKNGPDHENTRVTHATQRVLLVQSLPKL